MTTMVERVARALTETQIRTANELFKLTNPRRVRTEERIIAAVESGWRLNEKDARAAIEAMMEPTPRMISEGESAASFGIGRPHDDEAVPRVWEWMLQAALKEET